jgi:hypothetical protein
MVNGEAEKRRWNKRNRGGDKQELTVARENDIRQVLHVGYLLNCWPWITSTCHIRVSSAGQDKTALCEGSTRSHSADRLK